MGQPTLPVGVSPCAQVALGILRRSGVVDVVTAEDGVQALEVIEAQGPQGPDAFDLILMDLHMPRMVGANNYVHAETAETSVYMPALSAARDAHITACWGAS
jgi:CheY-like chemotaxis protein